MSLSELHISMQVSPYCITWAHFAVLRRSWSVLTIHFWPWGLAPAWSDSDRYRQHTHILSLNDMKVFIMSTSSLHMSIGRTNYYLGWAPCKTQSRCEYVLYHMWHSSREPCEVSLPRIGSVCASEHCLRLPYRLITIPGSVDISWSSKIGWSNHRGHCFISI